MSSGQTQLLDKGTREKTRDVFLFLGILAAGVLMVVVANAVLTRLRANESASHPKPAVVEAIEGSDLKRVTLTNSAAERLGVHVTQVREVQFARTRRVGGEVVVIPLIPVIPVTGDAGGAGEARHMVRVALTEGDLSQVDRSQPVWTWSLDDDEVDGFEIEPAEAPGVDDAEDEDPGTGALYYEIVGEDAAFEEGQPVFVELPLLGSGAPRLVVPYAAVIYDVNGNGWVYTNPEPLVFVRHAITIDYIEGDLAFLTDGPPAGTPVVTVAAAELYGTETGVSK